jgi:hypothetical protein
LRQRHIFLLTTFLCASSLWAGEQLSSAELVKRSVAIADVTVQWDTTQAQPKITLEAWLKAPESKNRDALQTQQELERNCRTKERKCYTRKSTER